MSLSSSNSFLFGLVFLSICLVAFITQTFVVNHLQGDLKYNQPFFMLWLTHSSQLFVFPLGLLYWKLIKKVGFVQTIQIINRDSSLVFNSINWFTKSFLLVLFAALILNSSFYLWYYSAGLTDVTTLTIIYNTNCFFAYLFSVLFRLEKLLLRKVVSLLLAIGGVLIVVLLNKKSESTSNMEYTTLGNILVSISSIFAGLYEVVYSVLFVKQKISSLFTYFLSSYIGLVTFTVFSIFIPILHYAKIEVFQLPNTLQLNFLILNIVLGVVYNTSFFALIEKTSPLFTSIGLILVVPLTPIVEKIIGTSDTIKWNFWVGAVIVLLSFFLLVIPFKKPKFSLNSKSSKTHHITVDSNIITADIK